MILGSTSGVAFARSLSIGMEPGMYLTLFHMLHKVSSPSPYNYEQCFEV